MSPPGPVLTDNKLFSLLYLCGQVFVGYVSSCFPDAPTLRDMERSVPPHITCLLPSLNLLNRLVLTFSRAHRRGTFSESSGAAERGDCVPKRLMLLKRKGKPGLAPTPGHSGMAPKALPLPSRGRCQLAGARVIASCPSRKPARAELGEQ